MSTVDNLLAQLESNNIRIGLDDNKNLKTRGDKRHLTPALINQIKQHKPQLVALLSGNSEQQSLAITAIKRDQPSYPLSFVQKRLWFIDQMDEGSSHYNMFQALEINGDFDIQLAEQAFVHIIERHEALRTVFGQKGEEAYQMIRERFDFSIELHNVGELTAADQPARIEQIINKRAAVVFDLSSDLMLKVDFIRQTANSGVLLCNMHHIASDGWSLGVLFSEFSAIYEMLCCGKEVNLPPLPVQYVDFSAWQNQWLSEQVQQRQLDYWQKKLDGLPDVHGLPLDKPRAAEQTYRGAAISVQIDNKTLVQLKALALTNDCTLFMLLHGVFALLIARHASHKDIAIGIPVANRQKEALKPLIGCFINTLVLRADCSENVPFIDYLSNIKQTNVDAQSNQDVSFEQVVERLKPRRSNRHSPLFQIAFTIETNNGQSSQSPQLDIKPYQREEVAAKYELILYGGEMGQGMNFEFEYNRDLFDASSIQTLAEHLLILLQGVIASPQTPIFDLPIMAAPERQFLLHQVQGQKRLEDEPVDTLLSLFEHHVQNTPDALAVTFAGESLSYRQLNARANQLAHFLIAQGIVRDTLVGLSLSRSFDIATGILAIVKAGGAYVPLDGAYPADRLAYMMQNSDIKVVLSHSNIDNLPWFEQINRFDMDTLTLDQYDQTNPNVSVLPSQLAYVIYTSGSTGMPKGVMVEHCHVRRLFSASEPLFGFGANDVWCLFHSYAFDFSVWEFWGALAYGGRLVIVAQVVSRSPQAFYQLVVDEKVTVLNQTPTAFTQFNQQDQLGKAPLALRTVIFGGEALNLTQLQSWVDRHDDESVALVNMYGITETTVHVTYRRVRQQDITDNQGSLIGQPLAGLSVLVLDEQHQPVPLGSVGQMYVGGAGVSRGYLNQPQLTKASFIDNPHHSGQRLYKTGDLARWIKTAELEYLGRIDEQVKIRGFRIELGDIEHHICDIHHVDSARLLVVQDNDQEKTLVAYVVADSQYHHEKSAVALHVLPNNHAIAFQNISEADFLYHEIYEEKSYVKQGIVLEEGAVVLDVGANIGMFSLFVSDICPGARIYAFEPTGPVYETLDFNATRHNSNITTFNFGLSDSTKQMEFTFYPSNTVMSGVYSDVEQDKQLVKDFMVNRSEIKGDDINVSDMDDIVASRFEEQQIECHFRPLSEVVSEQNITRIDLLKIDVEKAELDVLAGINDTVWAMTRQVIIEVHDMDGRLQTVTDLLQQHGFIVVVEQEEEAKNTVLHNVYARKEPTDEQAFANFNQKIDKILQTPRSPEVLTERSIRQYLEFVLPEHMIPHTIMMLDKWPLTPNGKIDTKALPAPKHIAQQEQYEGPKTRAEHILVDIWAQLLKQDADSVNVHSNFFESGGDSILSTQLVARVAAQGLEITVKQLFEYQTIRQLALHAKYRKKALVSQQAVEGVAPLLPIAKQFFTDVTDKDHFNQSVMLSIDKALSRSALMAITKALLIRHDALRLRFTQVDGQWQSHHVVLDEAMIKQQVKMIDLQRQTIKDSADIMAQCQQSLDIENGPILTINQIYNQMGEVRLLIVIHHLVVDGVSWRVLLQDINTALVQLRHDSQASVKLPAKTSSFKQWGEFLHTYVDDKQLRKELPLWQQIVSSEIDEGVWLQQTEQQSVDEQPSICHFSLDKNTTDALLRQAGKAYRTQINELLLAGLMLGYQRWSSNTAIRIDLESHGREPLTDTLDLSETLGWFTSMYPLTLSCSSDDIETLICAVKEQYRAIPHHGIGYGVLRSLVGDDTLIQAKPAAMVFNYLGQFDQSVDAEGEFAIATESMGEQISSNRPASHLISLNSIVSGDVLRCNITFDSERVSYHAVAAFADMYQHALSQIIDHCVAQEKGKLTPSDFPLARISQSHLDTLASRYDIADLYPATPMQQGLLFYSAIDPAAYVTQIMLTFENGFNTTAFVQAWQQLIDHHDVFKTAFVDNNQSQFLQLICQQGTLDWHLDDISAMDPLCQQQLLEEQRLLDKQKGYDTEKSPLSRIRMWHLGEGRYQVLWSQHHALYDGWCLPILFAQLSELYQAQLNHRPLTLPPAQSFRHYIQWLGQQDRQEAAAFWREELADIGASGRLFGVNPSAVTVQPLHQSVELSLSVAQTGQLQRLASKTKATVNIILQSAWAYLLGNYNYEQTVVFGSIVSGRPPQLDGVENMVGLFINTLPTRIDIDGQLSVGQWLAKIHQSQIDRDQYSHCSLQEISDIVGVGAGESLLSSLLVFENYPVDESLAGNSISNGLTISDMQVFEGTNFPITLMASVSDKLNLRLEYDSSLYQSDLMEKVAVHLQTLLMSISENEHKLVADLEFMPLPERRQLLKSAQGSALELPSTCIHQLVEQQAHSNPSKVAVVAGEKALDYRTLNQHANQLAHYLREEGLQTGQLVGICIDRDEKMPMIVLAVLKAGGVYVPLDPNYPQLRIEHIISDSGVSQVITSEQWRYKFERFNGKTLLFDEDTVQTCSMENLLPGDIQLSSSDLAYVMYTSGSTGLPKGVEIGHDNVVAMLLWAGKTFGGDELSRTLASTSLNFDLSVFELFAPLSFGHQCVVVNSALDLLSEPVDVTLVNTVPSAMEALLAEDAVPQNARVINLAGEPLAMGLVNEILTLPQCQKVFNLYGPSEDTTYSTYSQFSQPLQSQPPIGRPISNTQAYILSPWGTMVPKGGKGELYLGGAGVTRGYRGNAALTGKRYLFDPFAKPDVDDKPASMYKTGDLVRMADDGQLMYLGRSDDQVKIRGFRIELGEIVNVLKLCEWVASATVVVDSQAFVQPTLVAYFCASANVPESVDQEVIRSTIREKISEQLPQYMVPKVLVLLAAMPLTPNGKIDRKSLPSPVGEGPLSGFVDAALTIEKQLQKAWMTVLELPKIGIHDNFFELGGNSLLTMLLKKQIEHQCGISVAIIDIFEYPSIATMAQFLDPSYDIEHRVEAERQIGVSESADIAIIAMSGRFPDARDVNELWHNLIEGHESLHHYSDEALLAAGIPESMLNHPDYVKSGVMLNDFDSFDAQYFGFTPKEAQVMDPQQRLLFECANEALEAGGYGDKSRQQSVGVFVGTSNSLYLFNHLLPQFDQLNSSAQAIKIGNDRDFSATRLAYKLNLNGPAINVSTACSTSLAAIHLACNSLRMGESRMALAGGATVANTRMQGYMYQQGDILSPDGHCRAFDNDAAGTRAGDGAGIVLLKRLEDALADSDHIYAVIKGSAMNNDGSDKVGFTAPSIAGQAAVIEAALHNAQVSPQSIQYVEAHGTGTRLGDPIEVKALSKAYRGVARQSCALGSVKPNVGHLDTAAGVTSLIKTAMALKHKQIPPSINFNQANSQIDFAGSPFYVNDQLRDWPASTEPCRAGVSSFGIGGTNVHMILEEAPAVPLNRNQLVNEDCQLLVLSAKTDEALNRAKANLADHLLTTGDSLRDIAFTLQVGRQSDNYRYALVAQDHHQGALQLKNDTGLSVKRALVDRGTKPLLVYMFTGQGTQYLHMVTNLYHREPCFQDNFDQCSKMFKHYLEIDLNETLLVDNPCEVRINEANERLGQTLWAQPLLFTVEYSLARMLASWGLHADIMIGHSVGEYVAACLSGVFSLPDAVKVLATRSRLMQDTAPGNMLSVAMTEAKLAPLLQEFDCSMAAVNSARNCVASGTIEAIASLHDALKSQKVACQLLANNQGFHSKLMQPVAEKFALQLAEVELNPPNLPFISNLTGTLIEPQQAMDPDYWVQHLLGTVKFAEGIDNLVCHAQEQMDELMFIEIGPGASLSSLITKHPQINRSQVATLLDHQHQTHSAQEELLWGLGKLWVNGVAIGWPSCHFEQLPSRVPLPTYPFDRQKFWVDANQPYRESVEHGEPQKLDIEQWLYLPTWTKMAGTGATTLEVSSESAQGCCLVLTQPGGLSELIMTTLGQRFEQLIQVSRGDSFTAHSDTHYSINPSKADDYHELINYVTSKWSNITEVVHCWGLDNGQPQGMSTQAIERSMALMSLFHLSQTLESKSMLANLSVKIVASQLFKIMEDDVINPLNAPLSAVGRSILHEFVQSRWHIIDVGNLPVTQVPSKSLSRLLVDDLQANSQSLVTIAYRGGRRWQPSFSKIESHSQSVAPMFNSDGVYLITGGLGGVGFALASKIAEQYQPKLVLLGRSELPPPEQWSNILSTADCPKKTFDLISKLVQLQLTGSDVMYICTDVSDATQVNDAVEECVSRFGQLDGVIHAVGIPSGGILQLKQSNHIESVISAKVTGTWLLHQAVSRHKPDFFVMCSSITVQLGGFGQFDYAAANAFEDSFAHWQEDNADTHYLAINWDVWTGVGMSVSNTVVGHVAQTDRGGIEVSQGLELIQRALAQKLPQIVISVCDFNQLLDYQQTALKTLKTTPAAMVKQGSQFNRPDLNTPFVAPKSEIEKQLAQHWEDILGLEPVGVNDNFLELGGDSLLAIQVFDMLKQQGIDNQVISIKDFYAQPQISALATRINEHWNGNKVSDQKAKLTAQGKQVEQGLL